MKTSTTPTLDTVDRGLLLQAAITKLSLGRPTTRPYWAYVRDLCSVGSTTAANICRELNINPDKEI